MIDGMARRVNDCELVITRLYSLAIHQLLPRFSFWRVLADLYTGPASPQYRCPTRMIRMAMRHEDADEVAAL